MGLTGVLLEKCSSKVYSLTLAAQAKGKEYLERRPLRKPQGVVSGFVMDRVGSSTERPQADRNWPRHYVESQVYKDSLRSSCTLKCL